jgi:hypothetical protein
MVQIASAQSMSDAEISWIGFKRTQSIQLELGGHGLFYSFNYERLLINNERFKTTGQIGLSFYPLITEVRPLWIPIIINEIISFGVHHIELGFGIVATHEVDAPFRVWTDLITGRLGYRNQSKDGRFFYRIGFTPFYESGMFENSDNLDNLKFGDRFHPSAGMSFGYSL